MPLEQVITLLKIPCFGFLHSNDSQIPRYLVSATSLYCFSRFWVEHRTSSDELNFSQDCCMIFQHAWIGSLWFWAAGVSYPLVKRLPTRMDISSVSWPIYVYIFIYIHIYTYIYIYIYIYTYYLSANQTKLMAKRRMGIARESRDLWWYSHVQPAGCVQSTLVM